MSAKNGKNIVSVARTKLQLIISVEIFRCRFSRENKILLLTAPTIHELNELHKMAVQIINSEDKIFIKTISQSIGYLQYIFTICKELTHNFTCRPNRILLASIDCTRLATMTKLLRPKYLETFDDGSANYRLKSLYFTRAPAIKSARSLLRRVFFPSGVPVYFRRKTNRHYTIYPYPINIVPKKKRDDLNLDWSIYLLAADREMVNENHTNFLLGTEFDEAEVKLEHLKKYLQPFEGAIFSICHPRSKNTIVEGVKFHRLQGCVESLIMEVRKTAAHPITVLHFGSSVSYTMRGKDGIYCQDLLKIEEAPTKI